MTNSVKRKSTVKKPCTGVKPKKGQIAVHSVDKWSDIPYLRNSVKK